MKHVDRVDWNRNQSKLIVMLAISLSHDGECRKNVSTFITNWWAARAETKTSPAINMCEKRRRKKSNFTLRSDNGLTRLRSARTAELRTPLIVLDKFAKTLLRSLHEALIVVCRAKHFFAVLIFSFDHIFIHYKGLTWDLSEWMRVV